MSDAAEVTKDAYVATLRAESAALFERAAGALDANVETCDDWTVEDLIRHVGEVYGFIDRIVSGKLTEPPAEPGPDPDPPKGAAVVDWAATIGARLANHLADTDPSTPMWSWGSEADARFYFRRMASETAIHRMDLDVVLGGAVGTTLDPEVAKSCVDEVFDLSFANALRGRTDSLGSIHVHRTDGEGEWSATFVDGEFSVERTHGKADVALKGPAAGLLAVLWGRGVAAEAADVQRFGDQVVADAWIGLVP